MQSRRNKETGRKEKKIRKQKRLKKGNYDKQGEKTERNKRQEGRRTKEKFKGGKEEGMKVRRRRGEGTGGKAALRKS